MFVNITVQISLIDHTGNTLCTSNRVVQCLRKPRKILEIQIGNLTGHYLRSHCGVNVNRP